MALFEYLISDENPDLFAILVNRTKLFPWIKAQNYLQTDWCHSVAVQNPKTFPCVSQMFQELDAWIKSEIRQNSSSEWILSTLTRVGQNAFHPYSYWDKPFDFKAMIELCEFDRFPDAPPKVLLLNALDRFIFESTTGESSFSPITLSSIHSSKGLEWDTVYLLNVNKDVIPFHRSEDEEEERRLLYVAATRARRNLEVLYLNESPSEFITPFLED
jgi:superfamily I DNA/RNA helicase